MQTLESTEAWGAIKTGTTANIFQNNRSLWGWGFNNPTQNLVDEFETGDPRLASTAYADGDVVLGIVQEIDFPAENETGYLNRKAALVQPITTKAAGQNIRKFRYADILLMKAEAAFHTGDEASARQILNMIRDRARSSTRPKGSVEGSLTYEPYTAAELDGVLPPVLGTVSGQDLLNAIMHERRVELAMESLRFWDQVRTGTYINSLPADVQGAAQGRTLTGVNPIPVLPIPLDEVQTWNLEQNPGY